MFVSPPLDRDVTIASTVTFNIWALESSMSANIQAACRVERILGDGSLSATAVVAGATEGVEMNTSARAENFTATPTSTAFNKGDRLLITPYFTNIGTQGGGFTATLDYDGTTAAADGDSYVTFTEDFGFIQDSPDANVVAADSNIVNLSIGDVTADTRQAFLIRTPIARTLSSVTVKIGKAGTPTDDYIVALQSDSAGAPSGTDLTSASLAGASVPGTMTDTVFDLTDTAMTADTPYWLVFRRSGGVDAVNVFFVQGANNAAQWRGPKATYNGTSWATSSTQFANNLTLTFTSQATTLYPTDTASDIDPGGGSVDTKEAWTSRGAGSQTAVTNTQTAPASKVQATKTAGGNTVEWYTKPLTAFTLGGVVAVNLWNVESSLSANATWGIEVAVTAGDGSGAVVWGYTNYGAEVFNADDFDQLFVSGDDVAVTTGQRIRLRIYWDDSSGAAMATSFTATAYYAGTSAAAQGDTYLTFGQTLTQAVTITDAELQAAGQLAYPQVVNDSQFDWTPFDYEALDPTTTVNSIPAIQNQRIVRENSAEGGTEGLFPTTANTGGASGDAFDFVSTQSGTGGFSYLTFTRFDDAAGVMGYRWISGSGTLALRWNTTPVNPTQMWMRFYFWHGNNVSANYDSLALLSDDVGGGDQHVQINANGTLRAETHAGFTSSGSVAIPLEQWVRIEARVKSENTTLGELEIRMWLDPNSTGAADDTILMTGRQTGNYCDFIDLRSSDFFSVKHDYITDNFGISSVDWLGPLGTFTTNKAKPSHINHGHHKGNEQIGETYDWLPFDYEALSAPHTTDDLSWLDIFVPPYVANDAEVQAYNQQTDPFSGAVFDWSPFDYEAAQASATSAAMGLEGKLAPNVSAAETWESEVIGDDLPLTEIFTDSAFTGAGARAIADNDAFVDTRSFRASTTTATGQAYLLAPTSLGTQPQSRIFVRFNMRPSRYPTGSKTIFQWMRSSTINGPIIKLRSDGTLGLYNDGNEFVASLTTPVSLTSMVRVELTIERISTTQWNVGLSLFSDPTSGTLTDSVTGVSTVTAGVRALDLNFTQGPALGNMTSFAESWGDAGPHAIWFDDFAISTTSMPAPTGTTPAQGERPSLIAAAHTFDQQQFNSLFDWAESGDLTGDPTSHDIAWYFGDVAVAGTALPASVDGVGSVPAPTAMGDGNTAPATVVGTGTVPAPTATGAATALPAAVVGTGTVPAPTAIGDAVALPATVAGIGDVPAPTATGTASGTAAPSTVAAIGAVPAPTGMGDGNTGTGGGIATITAANVTSGADDNAGSATSFNTASYAFQNNKLYMVSAFLRAGSAVALSSVTGGGLTWVLALEQAIGGGTFYIATFRALVTSGATTGALTLNTSIAPTSIKWIVDELSGVDTTGTNGSGAIVQSDADSGNATTASMVLAAFADATNNAVYAAVGHAANEAATVDASGGYTKLAEELSAVTPATAIATEFRLAEDTTVTMTWTTAAQFRSTAFEIKAAVTAGGTATVVGTGTVPAPTATGGSQDAVAVSPADHHAHALFDWAPVGDLTGDPTSHDIAWYFAPFGVDGTASPATVVGVGAVPPATAIGDATAAPATVVGTGTVPAPTATGTAVASPAAVVGTGSVPAPTATGTATAAPATVVGTGSVPAPTAQGAATAAPATVVGTGSVPPPTATGAATALPAAVVGTGAITQPTATGDSQDAVAMHLGGSENFVSLFDWTQHWYEADAGAITSVDVAWALSPFAATALPATVVGTGAVPPATATGAATAQPAVVVGTGSVPAPTATGAATALPATVVGTGSVPAPTAMGNATALPATVVGTGAVTQPTATGDSQDAVAVHLTGSEFASALFDWTAFWFDSDAGATASHDVTAAFFPSIAATALPATVVGTGSVPPPTAMGNATAAPSTTVGTGDVPAPAASGGSVGTATPGAVQGVGNVPAPTVTGNATALPSSTAGVGSVPTPTVFVSNTALPSTVVGTGTVPAPTSTGTATASPASVSGVGTVPAPSASGNATALPATVVGTGSVPPATATGTALASPATVAGVGTVPPPTAHRNGDYHASGRCGHRRRSASDGGRHCLRHRCSRCRRRCRCDHDADRKRYSIHDSSHGGWHRRCPDRRRDRYRRCFRLRPWLVRDRSHQPRPGSRYSPPKLDSGYRLYAPCERVGRSHGCTSDHGWHGIGPGPLPPLAVRSARQPLERSRVVGDHHHDRRSCLTATATPSHGRSRRRQRSLLRRPRVAADFSAATALPAPTVIGGRRQRLPALRSAQGSGPHPRLLR